MRNSISIPLAGLMIFCLMLTSKVYGGPKYYCHNYSTTSLGVRFGWSGGPNGLTFRRSFAPGQAIEMVAGYSPKYGKYGAEDPMKVGNSFLGISYAPYLRAGDEDFGVSITGDMGVRMNYHHYRYFADRDQNPIITPDLCAGLGMQLDFSERVELFADLHIKYFSTGKISGYVPGMESGAGIRFILN